MQSGWGAKLYREKEQYHPWFPPSNRCWQVSTQYTWYITTHGTVSYRHEYSRTSIFAHPSLPGACGRYTQSHDVIFHSHKLTLRRHFLVNLLVTFGSSELEFIPMETSHLNFDPFSQEHKSPRWLRAVKIFPVTGSIRAPVLAEVKNPCYTGISFKYKFLHEENIFETLFHTYTL